MESINLILNSFDMEKIDKKFIKNGAKGEYLFRASSSSLDYSVEKIEFGNMKEYAIILQAFWKGEQQSIAQSNFDVDGNVLDVLIGGKKGMYYPLIGVYWQAALLGKTVELAGKAGLDAVLVNLPNRYPVFHDGRRRNSIDKTEIAVKNFGFQYSEDKNMYVMDVD